MFRVIIVACLLTCFAWTQKSTGVPASAPAPGSPAELVKQGEKLNSEGKQDEALALYGKAKVDQATGDNAGNVVRSLW